MDVLSKRYHQASSSDESIENLLYFKDCQHKTPAPKPVVPLLKSGTERTGNDCPFPKMCCALTCGNQCESSPYQSSFTGQRMETFPPIGPMNGPAGRMAPRHPQLIQPPIMQRKKKKGKPGPNRIQLQPPIGSRRDFGSLTKDRIKSLINQDGDIRKILKDLVRVTMKKVDLVDMINTRRTAGVPNVPMEYPEVETYSANTNDEDEDDDLE